MIDASTLQNAKTDSIGFFRFKKFDENTYLITNDVGRFSFLTQEQFELLIRGEISQGDLYDQLVKDGFIKTDDYVERMTGSFVLKNHFLGLGPTLHMVVTTLRCNHHCKYCHAAVAPMTATNFDMTLETAQKVLETMFHTNASGFTIEFQGGESLVNWDVVKYFVENGQARAIYFNKNVTFALVTNLTLMTEEKMNWLIDNNVYISTSLDGDEVYHNNNRTGYDGNSHEKVTYWIQRINAELEKKAKPHRVGALLTLTKENLTAAKTIVDEYMRLGLNGIFLRWLNPYGFASADLDALMYEPHEWLDMYRNTMDYIIEINKKGTKFREQLTQVYLQKIFNPMDPSFMDIRSPSGLAIGGVAYNYDGKVYASDESRMLGRMGIDDFLMTDLKENGAATYKAMMNSDITKIAVQATCLDGLPGYNENVYKPYIGVDVILNYKMTGSIYNPYKKDSKFILQEGVLDYIFDKLRDPEVKAIFQSWLQQG